MPETARFPPALVALVPVCYDKTQVVRQQSESKFPKFQRSFLERHGKGMSLFVTQLHFRPFPAPHFIKRPVVFDAHFLVLIVKAVGQARFSSSDIDGLCGVKIIKLAFIKLVALTVGDKFLFFAFLLYLPYGKERHFVPVVNGNVQPCKMIVACPISSFTAFKHIPKGQAVVIEDTENIITPSACHHEITAKPL